MEDDQKDKNPKPQDNKDLKKKQPLDKLPKNSDVEDIQQNTDRTWKESPNKKPRKKSKKPIGKDPITTGDNNQNPDKSQSDLIDYKGIKRIYDKRCNSTKKSHEHEVQKNTETGQKKSTRKKNRRSIDSPKPKQENLDKKDRSQIEKNLKLSSNPLNLLLDNPPDPSEIHGNPEKRKERDIMNDNHHENFDEIQNELKFGPQDLGIINSYKDIDDKPQSAPKKSSKQIFLEQQTQPTLPKHNLTEQPEDNFQELTDRPLIDISISNNEKHNDYSVEPTTKPCYQINNYDKLSNSQKLSYLQIENSAGLNTNPFVPMGNFPNIEAQKERKEQRRQSLLVKHNTTPDQSQTDIQNGTPVQSQTQLDENQTINPFVPMGNFSNIEALIEKKEQRRQSLLVKHNTTPIPSQTPIQNQTPVQSQTQLDENQTMKHKQSDFVQQYHPETANPVQIQIELDENQTIKHSRSDFVQQFNPENATAYYPSNTMGHQDYQGQIYPSNTRGHQDYQGQYNQQKITKGYDLNGEYEIPLKNIATIEDKFTFWENGIVIKRDTSLKDKLKGCSESFTWDVYKKFSQEQVTGRSEFRFKSRGNCDDRFLMGPCKPAYLECYSKQDQSEEEYCLCGIRECKFSFFCCNRQILNVYYTENQQKIYLGRILNPFNCSGIDLHIHGDADQLEYGLKSECCQFYFWCRCPCGFCTKLEFDIIKPVQDQGQNVVGKIYKTGTGMTNAVVTDFVEGSNWQQKALLMFASVFIDYAWFSSYFVDDIAVPPEIDNEQNT